MDDLQSKTVISCAEKRIPRGSFVWRLSLLTGLNKVLTWFRKLDRARIVAKLLLAGSLGLSSTIVLAETLDDTVQTNIDTPITINVLDNDTPTVTLDIIAISRGSTSDQKIFLNRGDGDFSVSSLNTIFINRVALGDLDGDGDLDGVATVASDPNEIWLNDGSGGFSIQTLGHDGFGRAIALGDLDSDGDLDAIMCGDFFDPTTQLWLNDGSANFTVSTFNSANTADIALGDLDGDGDLDAIAANLGEPQTIWLNDGSANFSTTTFGGGSSTSVALGDLDGDGDLDAIIANDNYQPQDIWLNDGSANFSVQTLGGKQSRDIALGDLDGDGDLDAFITSYRQGQDILINDGSANFTVQPVLFEDLTWGSTLGDLDSDGDLDAVIVTDNYAPNIILFNDGSANFTPQTFGDGLTRSLKVSLGDLDGHIPTSTKTSGGIGDDKLPHQGLPVLIDPNPILSPEKVNVIQNPQNGTTNVNITTGEITYTPDFGFTGTDVFTYTNGFGSAQVTVNVIGGKVFLPIVIKPN